MIEAICWDVGGVFSARPVDAVARVAATHGLDADEVFAAIFGPYHEDGDHIWHRLERGEVALSEAWAAVEEAVAGFGIGLTLPDFFAQFGHDEADRAVVPATVTELHASGITMAIVTNNVAEFGGGEGAGWRSIVPMEAMSAVVDSSAVGMRKPNPAIYHHVLSELGGIRPERAVFVDDMPANVEAARTVGMHGIVVEADPAPAMVELRRLVAELSSP